MANLAVPVPANGVAGVDVTAAFWNAQVRDAISFVLNPPIAVMVQKTVQTIPNASGSTYTSILFDYHGVDSYGGHSTTTNSSRYTAQLAGWYQVTACYAAAFNTTGARGMRLAVNGSPSNGTTVYGTASSTTATAIATAGKVFLNLGDYLEAQVQQSSGGNLDTIPQDVNGLASSLTVEWRHA